MKTEEEAKRKKEILLGINPCIYGLNYHDPAVVVLIDGRVAFGVEEERCNRVKHSKGVFPSEALANCLAYSCTSCFFLTQSTFLERPVYLAALFCSHI